LDTVNSVVKPVARQGIYFNRILSPIGRNAQQCASVFGVSVTKVTRINKKTAWTSCNYVWQTDSDSLKLKMISQLLCIKHHYLHLTCLTTDDVDIMIEFLCTD